MTLPGNFSKMMVCIIFILVVEGALFSSLAGEIGPSHGINCNIHQNACSQKLPGYTVKLDITPKPVSAMMDLSFRVLITGGKLQETPYIDLEMPGMKMGSNRVRLKAVNDTTYVGKGVIVRCPSGRRVWRATVTFPQKGAVEFIFDVIY